MEILSALFAENINPPSQSPARIDLLGIMFSIVAPSPPPVTLTPHLFVIIRCRPDEDGEGILEVLFRDEAGEQVARNVSPFRWNREIHLSPGARRARIPGLRDNRSPLPAGP